MDKPSYLIKAEPGKCARARAWDKLVALGVVAVVVVPLFIAYIFRSETDTEPQGLLGWCTKVLQKHPLL